jgi:adenine-specific DNA-methyltransferase
VFASPQMAWYVEGLIRERFNVLVNIRWQKPAFSTKAEMTDKAEMRAPFPASETIIFAEHESRNQELGQQFQAARERVGLTRNNVEVALGYISTANPNRGTALCYRWEEGSRFPTEEAYYRLQNLLNTQANGSGPVLTDTYEELRRPFNATPDTPYTDVWTFPTVGTYPGKHPCEKPLALMEHIVSLSSRPGAVVLDCFAGYATTGKACLNTGRKFIGIEKDPGYFDIAGKRLGEK